MTLEVKYSDLQKSLANDLRRKYRFTHTVEIGKERVPQTSKTKISDVPGALAKSLILS